MDFRHFFTSNSWWGKIIGAFFGFLAAGPIGALIGIFIGNLFDRGLYQHFSRQHWQYHAEKHKSVQNDFFRATFSVMGHIAKANGHVSVQDIRMAKSLMQEMGLTKIQIKAAQDYFTEGKKKDFNLDKVIINLRQTLRSNPELLKLFIDIQYRAALVDGLSFKKQQVFNSILNLLDFAPLHKQNRFFEDFANFSWSQNANHQQSSSSYQQQNQQQRPKSFLDQAYAILEVSPRSSKQEIKQAYRRLTSRNHPDKLIAKGLPESMIKIANEKTQAIRKAYEQISESKGW
jgi:DnaJ like chaperone protein